MRWTWDPNKNRRNKSKHGLSFDTAMAVFDDPLAIWRRDFHRGEERWQIIGAAGVVTIFVVYVWSGDSDEGDEVRIVSARKATPRERRAYEEGEF
jgi:uncharacterized DUF497 family protein